MPETPSSKEAQKEPKGIIDIIYCLSKNINPYIIIAMSVLDNMQKSVIYLKTSLLHFTIMTSFPPWENYMDPWVDFA